MKRASRAGVGASGPDSIAVSGATVSTLNSIPAGVASTLSAKSTARTLTSCGPSARFTYRCTLVHVSHTPPSSRHSTRATPERVSAPAKAMSAVRELVAVGGPEPMVVVGAVLSSLIS